MAARMSAQEDLAELVADVKTLLQDYRLRGALLVPTQGLLDRGDESPLVETMDQIKADLGDCRRCVLCQERQNVVFGVGDPQADLAIVGEAPGLQEDRKGEPFVGPAGEMLDKMLLNVLGLPRNSVYICNIVKCRPPGNRNPLPDEVGACMPFLERQLRAIQPKVILVLGTVAFKSLFDTTEGIMRSRGIWREYEGIPAMPTFHPAYLLRQASEKRKTFEDLKALRVRYDELGGRR